MRSFIAKVYNSISSTAKHLKRSVEYSQWYAKSIKIKEKLHGKMIGFKLLLMQEFFYESIINALL